jgi:recombination protein RecT
MTDQDIQFNKFKSIIRSDSVRERFIEVLGSQNAGAYISSVINAVGSSDRLMQCEIKSILTAAMSAATLRLSCDPSIGHAYIIPYKNTATFVVGYRGLQHMAVRTGKYRFINVARIYNGQKVSENQLTGQHTIEGVRIDNQIVGYLLYFELLNRYSKTFYMTVEEIDDHARRYAPSYNKPDGLWKKDFDSMARKTVLRLGLSRYGYIDPVDAGNMAIMDERDSEAIDSAFSEEKEEKPVVINEAQTLKDMGFPVDEQPEPQEQTEQKQAQDSLRPYTPEQLKQNIKFMRIKFEKENKVINPQYRNLIAPNLEMCFIGQDKPNELRHTVLNYLVGKSSVKELTNAEVLAIRRWLDAKLINGEWLPSEMATKEAQAVITAALEEAGQGKLEL